MKAWMAGAPSERCDVRCARRRPRPENAIAMEAMPYARKHLAALLLPAFAVLAAPPAGAADAAADAQRVTIVGGSCFFRPERIVVRADRPLELSVSMESGLVPHRFVLEAADGRTLADVELSEQPQILRLELSRGEYAYHCPNRLLFLKSHRERGMAGVLVVEE